MMKVHKDDNGDLSSVEINIRCCFDGLPISRWQAKSLCGRVNDFKRISLDFEGVEWMGQGFAHQLFVVYQNLNPDVKLLPIRMNQTVQRMYHHVIQGSRDTRTPE